MRHSGERTIRVIGVGGAGGNAVNHMIRAKQRGVDYIAVNTDAQVLDDSLAPRRVQIGEQLTQGLGAGGDAAIGRQAAEEDAEEINRMVAGSDLVFIAAGLGGGTGSGAAPVIAAQARKVGALTVGVVTRPFEFEGSGRRKIADAAEAELKANVDTLLLIENERVLSIVGEDTSMLDAFTAVNEVLAGTVRAVVDIMTVPGLINLDFADVRAIMQDGGMATAGIGAAVGPERAVEAAHAAVANPLLNHDLAGAGAILLNVAGASGMTMREVTRAAEVIRSAADPEAMIIFGTIFDDHLDDELRVTVIATRLRDEFAYVSRVASDDAIDRGDRGAGACRGGACRGGRGHRCGGRGRSARSRSARGRGRGGGASLGGDPDRDVRGRARRRRGIRGNRGCGPRIRSRAIRTMGGEPGIHDVRRAGPGRGVSARGAVRDHSSRGGRSRGVRGRGVRGACGRVLGLRRPRSPRARIEPWAAAVIAPSEPDEAVPEALTEQSWSAPVEAAAGEESEAIDQASSAHADAAADESEAAEQSSSAPADEAPEPESEPWAAAATLAATTFAQSEPDQTVSELEPAEEPAPSRAGLIRPALRGPRLRALVGRRCARRHDIRPVRAGPDGF